MYREIAWQHVVHSQKVYNIYILASILAVFIVSIPAWQHTSRNIISLVLVCVDWLIDRRHCNLRWASEAKAVRERLQQALAQLPSHPAELKEASQKGELG